MVATAWPFVELNEDGVAFVQGTRTKVVEIVECHVAYRWDAEQTQLQLSGLTLPQIHAALGYYYEHKSDFDTQLLYAHERSEDLRRRFENPELMQVLRSKLAR